MFYYFMTFGVATLAMFFSGLFGQKRLNDLFLFFFFLWLVFLSGTRYHLGGYDYQNYAYYFQNAPDLANLHFIKLVSEQGLFGSDSGWLFFNALIKSLGLNFYGLTLAAALIFWMTLYFVVRPYITNLGILGVMVMYKYLLDVSFIYMRQSLAVAIFLMAVPLIIHKKLIPYLLLVTVAAMVHFSAVILLPVYLVNYLRISKKGVIIYTAIFSATYILTLLHVNVLQYLSFANHLIGGSGGQKLDEAASGNLYGDSSLVSNFLHLAEFLLIDLLLIFNWDKIKWQDRRVNTLVKLFLLLLPLYSLFANSAIMVRDGFYFLFTYAIVIDLVTRKARLQSRLLIYLGVALVSAYGMFRFASNFDNGGSSVYDSYLFHDDNIWTPQPEDLRL
ncbi:EpsG family protein [Lactobacillaceae bacterium L1_55_11]|nr:EpsG family protein [Lactobacillaceae bacterium L1_55_11]